MTHEEADIKTGQKEQPKNGGMSKTMQAAVLYGAKDVRIKTMSKPELSPGMVLLKIKRAGICGSDLHYYEDGYIGTFIPSQPFVLGHELVATVEQVYHDHLPMYPPIGARVTVNPARACLCCNYCKSGRANLCPNTIMLGSGSTVPPTNGAFAEYITVRADQCFVLPDILEDGIGAMIEPLAVALQGLKQAGNVSGKQVLVTGAGTIGLLTAIAAKAFGAVLVAVSDVVAERRQVAIDMGADAVFDPTDETVKEQVEEITKEGFDCILEASGARPALRQAFDFVKRGGTIVQIGSLGQEDIPLPANQLMVKEICFIGSFRYANIFHEAISLVSSGHVDLEPFITGVFPLCDAAKAIETAMDRVKALKVQITM